MCQRITCNKCGALGYVGCGRHVEQVLGDVPPDERCKCRAAPGAAPGGGIFSNLWRRFFGK